MTTGEEASRPALCSSSSSLIFSWISSANIILNSLPSWTNARGASAGGTKATGGGGAAGVTPARLALGARDGRHEGVAGRPKQLMVPGGHHGGTRRAVFCKAGAYANDNNQNSYYGPHLPISVQS